MINKIEFKAKNLTSNAGLFLMLENTKINGISEMIENDLNFESASANKIKMNHIKTMHCGYDGFLYPYSIKAEMAGETLGGIKHGNKGGYHIFQWPHHYLEQA